MKFGMSNVILGRVEGALIVFVVVRQVCEMYLTGKKGVFWLI